MKNKLSWLVFRATCALARLFFPEPALEGTENLPAEPCIIIGNHAQMAGPIYAELYIPGDRLIWCNAEMLHLKEVPDYAFQDFWSKKPAWNRWFFRLFSYVIAPLSVCVFNNAHCVGVYRDSRVMSTLRESMARMEAGANIIIFPEHEVPHNRIVWDFQEGFVNLARMYARRTGKPVSFVPVYIAPELKKCVFGAPIPYDDGARPDAERRRICDALMDAITGIAVALPRHRVVPYPNLPKKDRPYNRPDKDLNA